MNTSDKILITGAAGQLGRLVIAQLLRKVRPDRVVATARKASAAQDLAALGVDVREASYDDPAALDRAFAGTGKALLISSSEVGQRVPQHRNVIDAAKRAKVGLFAYTSILHADRNPMALAPEHKQTEALIEASGVPFVLLRDGWYTENYTVAIAFALQSGAVFGSAGEGRISAAARQDYAEAAAAVLLSDASQAGKIYELAGDKTFTLAEYAAEIARQSGKAIVYRDLPQADYKAALQAAGLPEGLAAALADSDAWAAKGELFDAGRQLSALIGRPTTPLAASVAAALSK
ncbi:MAG TPA: SDR family oxidoreductase [Rhizomicrobium sp.]